MMAASKRLLVLFMSLALFACGGSGSGSKSTDPDIVTPDPVVVPTPDAPVLIAEGRAVKGVLSDATVNAYRFVAGKPGEWALFDFTRTDENGYFDLDVSGESGPVLIEVLANVDTRMVCDVIPSCGEIAFGEAGVIPDADFRLLSIIPSDRLNDPIAVTPLTHLAASWVETLSGIVPVSDSMARMAIARVADLFDLSPDFAHQLPIDLTSEVETASDDAVLHAVVSASFAQLAYGRDAAVTIQFVLDLFAEQFAELGGQLMLVTEDEEQVSVDILQNAAEELLFALFDEESRASLFAAVENLFSDWAHDPLTAAGGAFAFDTAEYNSALVLLDDLEYYLAEKAGIDASGTFLATQMDQLNWLYQPDDGSAEDTVNMVRVLAEGAAFAVVGVVLGFDEIEGCFDLGAEFVALNLPEGYAQACSDGSIRLLGERHHQTVDARIEPLASGFDIQFTLKGNEGGSASLANDTFTGELDGVLELDLSGLQAIFSGDLGSLADASFGLRLAGGGSLIRNSAPGDHPVSSGEGFVADLDLSGVLNLAAIFNPSSEEPLLLIQIDDGSLESPFGDKLFAVKNPVFCKDRQPLRIAIASDSSMEACFGFEAFNMPEMRMTLGGSLSGLFQLVGQLFNDFSEGDGGIDDLIDGLDISALSLLGDARLKILDLERGTRDYRFKLNNNRLRATLVDTGDTLDFYVTGLNGGVIVSGSTLVATVNADWSNLGGSLHFADGSKRSYLLGPISDVVDENLINVLLGSLFAGIESIGLIIGPLLGGGLALPATGIVPCIEGC